LQVVRGHSVKNVFLPFSTLSRNEPLNSIPF
jgi:hypothetical protein